MVYDGLALYKRGLGRCAYATPGSNTQQIREHASFHGRGGAMGAGSCAEPTAFGLRESTMEPEE